MEKEEFIKAEEIRSIADSVREKKRLEQLNKVKTYPEYGMIVEKIKSAANLGDGSIFIYPLEEEEYKNYVEENSLIPEEAKRFTAHMREVLAALHQYGNFDVAYNSVPIVYDEMGSTTRLDAVTVSWG